MPLASSHGVPSGPSEAITETSRHQVRRGLYRPRLVRMIGSMLRRMLAALLVAAIAAPMPALAGGGCPMGGPAMAAERCNCCKSGSGDAAGCPASFAAGCNCSLEADPGEKAMPAAAAPAAPAFVATMVRLPASLSTARCAHAPYPRDTSPPGSNAVSRPYLCSWIL